MARHHDVSVVSSGHGGIRFAAAKFGTSRIEIVLLDGTCVRVDDQVGAAALRQVMAVLRG